MRDLQTSHVHPYARRLTDSHGHERSRGLCGVGEKWGVNTKRSGGKRGGNKRRVLKGTKSIIGKFDKLSNVKSAIQEVLGFEPG